MTEKVFKLNTGASIPVVGLGTWQADKGAVANAVYHALKSGYRHIDAALCYGNENEVGEGIKRAINEGLCKREDIFVTTKLWNTYHRHVPQGLKESLDSLQLDYVDLYLMHWPVAMNDKGSHPLFPVHPDGSRDIDHERSKNWIDTYHEMEKLLDTGKVKAIGVSNCSAPFVAALMKEAKVVPAVDQIENHPYLPQQDIVDECKKHGILVTAYSPLGSADSPLLKHEVVKSIANKHNVAPTTVLLSWGVARDIVVIPKSVTPARIEANKEIIELSQDDIEALNGIHQKEGVKRFVYPPFGLPLGFPDKE